MEATVTSAAPECCIAWADEQPCLRGSGWLVAFRAEESSAWLGTLALPGGDSSLLTATDRVGGRPKQHSRRGACEDGTHPFRAVLRASRPAPRQGKLPVATIIKQHPASV